MMAGTKSKGKGGSKGQKARAGSKGRGGARRAPARDGGRAALLARANGVTGKGGSSLKARGARGDARPGDTDHPFWRGMGTWLARLLAFAAVVCAAARMMPEPLQRLPYVPILISATPWFALAALLALVLAVLSRRWLTVGVAIACVGLQVAWQLPFFLGGTTVSVQGRHATEADGPDLDDTVARVMTLNVYKGQADAAAVVDLVRDENVEVLALQETTDVFVDQLSAAGIDRYLPYHHVASSDGAFGNGVWSASELADPVDDEVGSSASFMPAGTVAFPNKRIRFVSVHTTAPVPGYWKQWDRSLDELAAMGSRDGAIYVFMGDFNATWDHAAFRDILGTRFSDAARKAGSGLTLTWPANRSVSPGLGVWQRAADGGELETTDSSGVESKAPDTRFDVPPLFGIDHILLDRGINVNGMELREIPGADHAALLGTIEVTDGAGQFN